MRAPSLRHMILKQYREVPAPVSEPESGLPRPSHAFIPYLTIGGLAALVGSAGAINAREWTAIVGASLAGGLGALAWSGIQRARLSQAADAWIAHGAGTPPPAGVVRERSAALVGARHRRTIASSLRRVVLEAAEPYLRSARVPVNAASVRASSPQLLRTADVLADTSRPVSARAVVLAGELITDPGSPVYRHNAAAALQERLRQTLFELERSF
jgi:hypothetical protein